MLRRDEWATWYATLERAFGGVPGPAEEHDLWNDLTEPERCIGVWDGSECVATAGAFSFRMTVPGGAVVPTAGVSMVSVAATHRRRGLLTAVMRRQLTDIRSGGEPLAVLGASEPAIYGRFGYGIATWQLSADIDTTRVELTPSPGADDVEVRYARPVDALEACEAVYGRVAAGRPGMLERGPGWERLPLLDPPGARAGASALQCVLARRDGEVTGYARFHTKPDSDGAGPRGTVLLRDLEALDAASRAALWRFLFGVDLTSTLRTRNLPVDDAFQHLVSDIRRCRVEVRDGLHLRLVDVGAALRSRAYRIPVDVVFEVEDAFCPWNEGRWRLLGGPEGASCERTGNEPDLSLSVRELGAAYLGGCTLGSLAAAGRVRELRPDALAEASSAFGSDLAPWRPFVF